MFRVRFNGQHYFKLTFTDVGEYKISVFVRSVFRHHSARTGKLWLTELKQPLRNPITAILSLALLLTVLQLFLLVMERNELI